MKKHDKMLKTNTIDEVDETRYQDTSENNTGRVPDTSKNPSE